MGSKAKAKPENKLAAYPNPSFLIRKYKPSPAQIKWIPIRRLNPNGNGVIKANQPGGYHNPDNGFAANGYPLRIVDDQSGICLYVNMESFRKRAFG